MNKKSVSYISFCNANCPVCNRQIADEQASGVNVRWTRGGHLNIELSSKVMGLRKVLLLACQEHHDQAQKILPRAAINDCDGYCGEWNPGLGLAAIVSRGIDDDRHEWIRLA